MSKDFWTIETMQIINNLTPDIKGKAFDVDWFLLRQRFEDIERILRNFIDNEECDRDHHGYCQTHGYFETGTCIMEQARKILNV